MKTTLEKLAAGILVAALAAPLLTCASALAGEYGGGLKGLRGTYVPVPAPAPIPDYRAKWYLRGDIGLGLNLDTKASESGARYGVNDNGTLNSPNGAFGLSSFNTDDGHQYGHSIGIGAGYYYSPNLRLDLTGELRMEKKSTTTGRVSYNDTVVANTQVNVDVRDVTTLQSAIFMANAYYDFDRVGSWKPYVGGGIGFAVNEVRRSHDTGIGTCDPTNLGPPVACNTPTASGTYTDTASREYTYTLAANLSAGVTYRVSEVTSLDFNYRYLYVGGTDIGATINRNSSSISIDDQHEHYLRAGLRFDIN